MSAVCNNSQACDSNWKTLQSQEHLPDSAISQPEKLILPMSVIGKFKLRCQGTLRKAHLSHENKIKEFEELVAVVLKGVNSFQCLGVLPRSS